MRTIFIALLFFAFSFPVFSQSSPIQSFYQNYKPKESVTEEERIKWLDKLIPKEIRQSELKALLEDSQKVQLLVLDRTDVQKADLDNVKSQATQEDLELIIRARDQAEKLDLFAKASDGYIRQVLYLVEEEDEFVFLNLSGKWTFKDFIGNRKREAY